MKQLFIIVCLLSALAGIAGCATAHRAPAPVLNIRLESNIPNVELIIYPKKDCEGNWNFCQYE